MSRLCTIFVEAFVRVLLLLLIFLCACLVLFVSTMVAMKEGSLMLYLDDGQLLLLLEFGHLEIISSVALRLCVLPRLCNSSTAVVVVWRCLALCCPHPLLLLHTKC